jgi:hypothetical protein
MAACNRVLLGKRDSQNFGLYVSRPGRDVLSCPREDLIISAGDLRDAVLHAQMDLTINASSSTAWIAQTASFTNLNYIPFVLWSQVGSDSDTLAGVSWYFNLQLFAGIYQHGSTYGLEVTSTGVKVFVSVNAQLSSAQTFRVLVFRIPAAA